MSQPCCFAHHNVTAESIPPDRRMIARSMMTVYVGRDPETARPRGCRLSLHKYLSQTRPTGGEDSLKGRGAEAGDTGPTGPRVRPRVPRSVRRATAPPP